MQGDCGVRAGSHLGDNSAFKLPERSSAFL